MSIKGYLLSGMLDLSVYPTEWAGHLPISGVSACHASSRLQDFVLMHNLVVSDRIKYVFVNLIVWLGWYIEPLWSYVSRSF